MFELLSILIVGSVLTSNAFKIYHQYDENFSDADDCRDALLLTPYINAGEIDTAQNLSKVKPLEGSGNLLSYSGFFTVDKKCNSNLFFWFFPAKKNYENAPVVVWLQGGPGSSSMFGLFTENGPFYVNDKQELKLRNYSWSSTNSMLFIDNPVGSGFSFTDKAECYAKNEDDVRKNLYNALIQFFKLFPNLQKNDFYVTGESYAGKYIPALGYTIHENNLKSPEIKINLKGLGIGDGWTDPEHMLVYSKYLYQIGLVDELEKNTLQKMETEAVEFINKKHWSDAFNKISDIWSTISEANGYLSMYNYLINEDIQDPYINYIQTPEVRCAIHVGNLPFSDGNATVYNNLIEDLPQSVKSWVEILVEHYKIIFYSGQVDIIVGYPLSENFIKYLDWSGANEYKKAKRVIVKDENGHVAGYIKTAKNLNVALIRNAGHMVPTDQPAWAYEFLEKYLFNSKNESM